MHSLNPFEILIGYLREDGMPTEKLEAAYHAVINVFYDCGLNPHFLVDEDGLQIILNHYFPESRVGLDVAIDAHGKILVEFHDERASGRHAQFETITDAADFIYNQIWSLSGSFGSPSIWRRRVDTKQLPLVEKTIPSQSSQKNVPSGHPEISARIFRNTILLETPPHKQVILSSLLKN